MTKDDGSEWLYVRMYPGRFDRMDAVVISAVAAAFEVADTSTEIGCGFFLRYIDERGPHVRLRFRGSAPAVNALERQIESILARNLTAIAPVDNAPAGRLIPWDLTSTRLGEPGFEWGLYEPEFEKYGGAAGVANAETVFATSSRLAVDALSGRGRDMSERATLALLLMEATLTGLGLEAVPFWDHYTHFWSGGAAPGADELRASFREATRRRRAFTRDRRRHLRQDPDIQEAIAPYLETLSRTVRRARAEGLAPSTEDLTFQHVHLTNNRLGFLPLEEAYLATFLLDDEPVASSSA